MVYYMMPIAAEKGLPGLHNEQWWPDIYKNLMKWLEYVKAFNDQKHAEMEDKVNSLPKENAPAESLRVYLGELGRRDTKERAHQLLTALDASV
uniref:RxLR effector candidate protein n=1 Tax=Hyaloperonospora arabidopsidis (strain Emoy2) TaxID=559515 RepID=M4BY38_HYAAE